MKTRLALILLLIASIFSAASTLADEIVEVAEEKYIRTVELYEGWNLVPFGEGIEFEAESNFENILEAAYVYDTDNRVFRDLLEDEGYLEELLEERKYAPIWIYLNQDAQVGLLIEIEEIQETVEDLDFEFSEGWNFYVVLPHMGKDYSGGYLNIGTDRYGNSYLENDRLFAWDNRQKSWEDGRYSEIIEGNELSDPEVIGLPIVMYYIDGFDVEFTPSLQYEIPDFPEI